MKLSAARRVLVLSSAIRPGGGPAGYTYNVATGYEALRRSGRVQNIFVFAARTEVGSRDPNPADDSTINAIKRMIVSFGLKRPVLYALSLWSQRMRRTKAQVRKADVVVFQGPYEAHFARYAKRHCTVVYMPHSPVPMADETRDLFRDAGTQIGERYYEKLKQEEGGIISAADFVVFPSPGARLGYDRYFFENLEKKAIYLKSGVHIEPPSVGFDASVLGAQGPRILFAGRYVTHRGYDLFCGAAELLLEAKFEAKFFSAGTGPQKMEDGPVRDLGWRSDISNVIKAADIIVVPNRVAYYDLLPLECAALGKPMVMTSVGGNADMIRDLPDVVPCQPNLNDVSEAIRQAVRTFQSNPGWGGRNRQAYNTYFSAECVAKRWDDWISTLPLPKMGSEQRVRRFVK